MACRGLVMPGASAWLDAPLPNSSVEQWRVVVIVTGYTLSVTSQYDAVFTFANKRFGEVCWHNMHIQGRQSSGREAVPSPRGLLGISTPKQSAKTHQIELWSTVNRWSFYQVSECQATLNRRKAPLSKTFCRRFYREGGARINLTVMETYKKDRYQLCCSCSSTTLTSKIITGMIENHSEFAACRNSCNEFVSSPSS